MWIPGTELKSIPYAGTALAIDQANHALRRHDREHATAIREIPASPCWSRRPRGHRVRNVGPHETTVRSLRAGRSLVSRRKSPPLMKIAPAFQGGIGGAVSRM